VTARFAHTNIVAEDFRALAKFYVDVFACVFVPPERQIAGAWLATGTGVDGAQLTGVHLRLPGHGSDGPTLEIFEYAESRTRPMPIAANRCGFGHIAFEVDDVARTTQRVTEAGGALIGDVVTADVVGAGRITFVYVADLEGNIIELQQWEGRSSR
jgi:catechol 2,3-dioxygenase-like lactoylglutathione lyase family enzyme